MLTQIVAVERSEADVWTTLSTAGDSSTADCCTVAGFDAAKPATAQHSAVSSERVSS
jgi:hypothetical protein